VAGYDTNLAAEFYVLAVLHRLGADANLTLGNAVTVDVKGLAGKTSWPVDNFREGRKRHFVIFVSFLNKIADPTVLPEVYVVRSEDVADLTYRSPRGRRVVQLSTLRKKRQLYENAWRQLLTPAAE